MVFHGLDGSFFFLLPSFRLPPFYIPFVFVKIVALTACCSFGIASAGVAVFLFWIRKTSRPIIDSLNIYYKVPLDSEPLAVYMDSFVLFFNPFICV